jgi:TonB family protein
VQRSRESDAWLLLTQLSLASGVVLGLLLSAAPAQEGKASDYQVKAAYLYNFAKLAEWPASTSGSGPATFIIGVVGGDPDFVAVLTGTVSGRVIGGRPVVVKRVSSRDEMTSCRLLFFRSSEHKHVHAAISALGAAGVLLVGEDPSFLENGGMVNLVLENGKIAFEVNRGALDHAQIRFSPQTLTLAKGSADSGRVNSPDLETEGSRLLRHSESPEYPEIAQRMNLKGAVQVEVRVEPDGTVKQVTVLGGHPVLADALTRAVMKWKYEPSAKETVEVVKYSFHP